MKKNKHIIPTMIIMAIFVVLAASCNKNVPDAKPLEIYNPTGNTLADVIGSDATLTTFKAAVEKAGLTADLADRSKVFTVFAPTDAGFTLSGLPAAAIAAIPAATVASEIGRAHV